VELRLQPRTARGNRVPGFTTTTIHNLRCGRTDEGITMLSGFVRNEHAIIARRVGLVVLAGFFVLAAAPLRAQTALPPVTFGAGLQTSFVHAAPDAGDSTDTFLLSSARLYVNGPVSDTIKFMFNAEYEGATNKIGVLDAVARFEFSPKFNIWAGRFLPPSDRANLYGPYYSHHWAVYSDGIQNGHPFVFQGRDNGVSYWGDFGKVKLSAGAFDGLSATGNNDILGAARVQINFWDPESGYYLNGTYYGGKDLLAVGAAVQAQSGNTATTVDFLLERKVPGGGVVAVESEYANYDKLGGYDSRYASSQGAYVLGSYLFPRTVGIGKFEILGKYAKANFTKAAILEDYDQKTSEFDLNYVIKDFNARVMFFFKNTSFSAVKTSFKQAGVGLQIQV
jgi:hypothetical protein